MIWFLVFFQQPAANSWICNTARIEMAGLTIEPLFKLDLVKKGDRVNGTLTVLLNGQVVRVSELHGTGYSDGSVALTERWSESVKEVNWLPPYQSILIPDINKDTFYLNYNSASKSRSHLEKGRLKFSRVHGEART